MDRRAPASAVAESIYVAWSLYTGPDHVAPLWEHSRWVSGEWTGINNKGLGGDGIQDDIEARVRSLAEAFKQALHRVPNGESATRYFVVPEFYFRCKQGPYPKVGLGEHHDIQPFDYIRKRLQEELAKVPLPKRDAWVVVCGSILTCAESDYDRVLSSREAKARLGALNEQVRKLALRNDCYRRKFPHVKALSYAADRRELSGPEKAIEDLMSQYRADPLCVVRNRGLAFSLTLWDPRPWTYEKQSESTVDLTMGKLVPDEKSCSLDPNGMITEWVAGYPSISIIGGDKQDDGKPCAARYTVNDERFGPNPLQVGIEICLDHRLKRLRRTVGMTKDYGADADNPPLHVQIIPSGGMQILDSSVAAGASGAIFNSDGCDPILDEYTDKGKPVIDGSGTFKQKTCGVYASSAQTLDGTHYSHSQLSFRHGDEEIDGYKNAGWNANGPTFDSSNANPLLDAYAVPLRIAVEAETAGLFAAGGGELHIYLKP